MKKNEIKEKLSQLFQSFEYHEAFLGEIYNLIVGSGKASVFIRMFEKNIKIIKTLGRRVIETENFEKLQGAEDLYSMKFKGKGMNYRILYSYDEESKTIMLHCFYEKSDSEKSRYSSHIPIAMQRKFEMEERDE